MRFIERLKTRLIIFVILIILVAVAISATAFELIYKQMKSGTEEEVKPLVFNNTGNFSPPKNKKEEKNTVSKPHERRWGQVWNIDTLKFIEKNLDCECDYHKDICEPAKRRAEKTQACHCDIDCDRPLAKPCSEDGHCDRWCKMDEDQDCEYSSYSRTCSYDEVNIYGFCQKRYSSASPKSYSVSPVQPKSYYPDPRYSPKPWQPRQEYIDWLRRTTPPFPSSR